MWSEEGPSQASIRRGGILRWSCRGQCVRYRTRTQWGIVRGSPGVSGPRDLRGTRRQAGGGSAAETGGGQKTALEDPMSLPALCVPPNTGLYNPTPFLSLSTALSGTEAAQLNQAAGPSPGPECQGHPAVTPSLCTEHPWVPPRVPRSGHWAASSPSQHELRPGPGRCVPSPSVPYSLL